jgi:hypothetical protein
MNEKMTLKQFLDGIQTAIQSGSTEAVDEFLQEAAARKFQPDGSKDEVEIFSTLQRTIENLDPAIANKLVSYFSDLASKEEGRDGNPPVQALSSLLAAGQLRVLSALGLSVEQYIKHNPPGSAPGLEALSARLNNDARRGQRILEVLNGSTISAGQAEVNRRMGISEEQFRRHNP